MAVEQQIWMFANKNSARLCLAQRKKHATTPTTKSDCAAFLLLNRCNLSLAFLFRAHKQQTNVHHIESIPKIDF